MSVVLSCEANGASSYSWERLNGYIQSSATGVNTNVLTINNLQSDDLDKYRCVATNGSGSDVSDYAELIANSKVDCLWNP